MKFGLKKNIQSTCPCSRGARLLSDAKFNFQIHATFRPTYVEIALRASQSTTAEVVKRRVGFSAAHICVRKPGRRKFFILTYILSLVWIGIISYLLVWWTSTFGRVVALPAPITGLVFFGPILATPCYIILRHAAKFGLGDLIFTFVNGLNIFTMTIG